MTTPALIAPEGELDLGAIRELAPELDAVVRDGDAHLILDLSAVTLVDSSALGAIVQTQHRLNRDGGTLSVIAPNGSAAAVTLELTGLRSRFSVFRSREEALG